MPAESPASAAPSTGVPSDRQVESATSGYGQPGYPSQPSAPPPPPPAPSASNADGAPDVMHQREAARAGLARAQADLDAASANDCGSGVAIMMELGNHMKGLKTNVGVDFVLFDGEEYIWQTKGPNKDSYFIGSEHFAKTWRTDKNRVDYAAAILLDILGLGPRTLGSGAR